ncbi:MAG: hypothetical protein HY721_24640 [Planctomycetes bacterium]|nr:hypothetical protein [Planctomycetota bacterium]
MLAVLAVHDGLTPCAHAGEDVCITEPSEVCFSAPEHFSRGDCNLNGSRTDAVSEAMYLLEYLFLGKTSPPWWCEDACDLNDDGALDVSDVVYGLLFAFGGGRPPADPFPHCGLDPTDDSFPPCLGFGFGGDFWSCELFVHRQEGIQFVRGDVDANGLVDEDDADLLRAFFLTRNCFLLPDCLDAPDVDDDGVICEKDAVALSEFVATGEKPPRDPYPACGPDPTPDVFACHDGPCNR